LSTRRAILGAGNLSFCLEAVPKLQFWNSNLGFKGKSGTFDRFFQELVSKPTGFWNKLS
jgi:hypothetical protein